VRLSDRRVDAVWYNARMSEPPIDLFRQDIAPWGSDGLGSFNCHSHNRRILRHSLASAGSYL
jgi:hypothetical protein